MVHSVFCFYTHPGIVQNGPQSTGSSTIVQNLGPTPAFGVAVVGSSARVTQSDVCDVTFPKTDCARRSPARLSRAHFFFSRGGGPLLLYLYRTGDEDISELPAESVVSFLSFFNLALSNISMNSNACAGCSPHKLHRNFPSLQKSSDPQKTQLPSLPQ